MRDYNHLITVRDQRKDPFATAPLALVVHSSPSDWVTELTVEEAKIVVKKLERALVQIAEDER